MFLLLITNLFYKNCLLPTKCNLLFNSFLLNTKGRDMLENIEIIDWKKRLLPYEQAVLELETKFRSIASGYRALGEYSPIEMVYGRVKNITSILDKVSKKGIPISQVEDRIDDIAGIRIVTKFVEDIAKIVMMIRERDGKDLTIIKEKDYINNTKESGYRSYHIIIKYPIYTSLGFREIFAEIQIRTLAMNFWATIEHSLRYKYSEDMPLDVQQRLTSCAEASFHLDNEMATIRSEIIEAQKIMEIKTALVNDILEKIKQLHFSAKIDEAEYLNRQFFELYNNDDLEKMNDFNKQLTVLTEIYRVHGSVS